MVKYAEVGELYVSVPRCSVEVEEYILILETDDTYWNKEDGYRAVTVLASSGEIYKRDFAPYASALASDRYWVKVEL
jgi:hypothetical protein